MGRAVGRLPVRSRILLGLSFLAAGCGVVAAQRPAPPTVPLLASLPAGKAPVLLAMAPDGKRVYGASADGKLTVIDTQARAVVATLSVSPFTSGIAVSPDGGQVYVTNLFGGDVAVLDTARGALGASLPLISSLRRGGYGRIAVAPDGSALYVANQGNRMMTRVDPRGGGPMAITPDMAPVDLAFAAGGRRLLLAGCKNMCVPGAVIPLEVASGDLGSTVFAGSRPYRVLASADGARVYLANLGGATVSVLDGASLAHLADVPVPSSPTSLALSPDGRRLYVASDDTGVVSAIDTTGNTVVGSARVGRQAREVVASPDGSQLWVSTETNVVLIASP